MSELLPFPRNFNIFFGRVEDISIGLQKMLMVAERLLPAVVRVPIFKEVPEVLVLGSNVPVTPNICNNIIIPSGLWPPNSSPPHFSRKPS